MGAFLDKPKTDKHNEHGSGNGLKYGVASMQGWRVEMEDAHCAITGLSEELRDWSFFAVFDGHAGARVSAHCAEHLLECIMSTEEFQQSDVIKGIRSGDSRLMYWFLTLVNLKSPLKQISFTTIIVKC